MKGDRLIVGVLGAILAGLSVALFLDGLSQDMQATPHVEAPQSLAVDGCFAWSDDAKALVYQALPCGSTGDSNGWQWNNVPPGYHGSTFSTESSPSSSTKLNNDILTPPSLAPPR